MAPDRHAAETGPFVLLEGALRDWAATAREQPLDPVTGIVPSNLLARRVEEVLTPTEGALLNLRLLTFLDLALALLSRERSGPPRVLQEPEKLLLLQDVLGEHPEPLWRESCRQESFLTGAAAAIGDLRESGARPEPSHLATLLDLWERRLGREDVLDPEGLLRAAAGVSRDTLDRELQGPLFLYGFYDLSPGQRDLLAALSSARALTLFVPAVAGDAGEYARPTSEWVADAIAPPQDRETATGANGPTGDRLRVVAAPGPSREADGIAEALLEERETGTAWEEMAVLLYDADTLRQPLARALESRGVPFADRFARPLLAQPHAAAAAALLHCVAGGFPWQPLLQLLTSPWLRSEPAADRGRWSQILLRTGVAGGGRDGPENWADGMDRLLPVLEKEARAESPAGTASTLLEQARQLVPALRDLFGSAGDLPDEGAPEELSDALRRYLNTWLHVPDASGEPGAAAARAAVDRILAQAGGRVRGTGTRSLHSLLEDVRLWIATCSLRPATPGRGVRLLDLMDARGLSFEVVAVPGLVEGRFPRGLRQDPLLPDSLRTRLGIPTRKHRALEDRLLFALADAAARRRLVLSWQRTDASGRRCAPSPVLREACRRRFPNEEISIDRMRKLLTDAGVWQDLPVTPLPHGSREDAELVPSALLRLTELHAAMHRRDAPGHEDLRDERLRRSLRAAECRRREPLSLWDGILGEGCLPQLGGAISPTRFEEYALCPFKYFFHQLLALEPVLTEPQPGELSPLERGSLTHDALEDTYESLRREGLLPVLPQRLAAALAVAEKEAERRLASQWGRGAMLPPLLRERERRRLLRNVRAVLQWDSADAESWVPHLSEASFGLDDEVPALELELPDGDTVSIRGRIDRVDLHADEPAARIVDYKTGRPPVGKVVKIREHMRYQLALYGLAVEDLLLAEDRIRVRDRLYVHLCDGELTERPLESMEREDLLAILQELQHGIARGAFFVAPGDHCRWCDFSTACRRHPVRRAQRKHDKDPAAAPWRAARGMEQQP